MEINSTANKIPDQESECQNSIDLKMHEEELEKIAHPLCLGQAVICENQLEHSDSTTWNLPFLYHFPKDTDTERLKNAVDAVLRSHPVFSCRFEYGGK